MTLKAAQLDQLIQETQAAYSRALEAERASYLNDLRAAADLRDHADTTIERDVHRAAVQDMIRDFWRSDEKYRPSVTDMVEAAGVSRARVYQIRDSMYAAERVASNSNETIL